MGRGVVEVVSASAARAEYWIMRPRILVCDDEPVLRSLIRAALGDDYDVAEASDGDESLALVRELRPDLVILDMMMPGRTGLDVLTEVRGDPELAQTKVLMLTARTQAADIEGIMRAGADRYVPKPFSPAQLVVAVDELVEQPS